MTTAAELLEREVKHVLAARRAPLVAKLRDRWGKGSLGIVLDPTERCPDCVGGMISGRKTCHTCGGDGIKNVTPNAVRLM